MPYVPDPTDATQPTDAVLAETAQAEFRALKARVNALAFGAAGNQGMPRQTVLQGLLSAAGVPGLLSIGAGLNVNLNAATIPAYLSYAAGYTNTGIADVVEGLTVDTASYWAALPASNISYLGINRVAAGVTAAMQTLAPPQYGEVYDKNAQSLLHFDAPAGTTTFLEDFGSTYTQVGGAKIQVNSFKFGSAALGGAGGANALAAADGIRNTSFTSLGTRGWAIRGWFNPSALPGAGNNATMAGAVNGIGNGAILLINNNAGTIRFGYQLSSTGGGADIGVGVGTTLPVVGTWYFVELTYDWEASTYRLYVNGAQEQAAVSGLKICACTSMSFGLVNGFGAGMLGYMDECELVPYCNHVAGTVYAVPVAAQSILTAGYASDWFDISTYTMKQVSAPALAVGSPVSFSLVNRLYVGEAQTSGAAVTLADTYAYQGRNVFLGAPIVINQLQSLNHRIGCKPRKILMTWINLFSDGGYTYGDEVYDKPNYFDGVNARWFSFYAESSRIFVNTGPVLPVIMNKITAGIGVVMTSADWAPKFYLDRGW